MNNRTLLALCLLWPFWLWAQGNPHSPLSYTEIDSIIAVEEPTVSKVATLVYAQQKAAEEYGTSDSVYLAYSLVLMEEAQRSNQYDLMEEVMETLRGVKEELSEADLENYYMASLRIIVAVYHHTGRAREAMKAQEEFTDLMQSIYGAHSIEHHEALILTVQLNTDLRQYEKAERLLQSILSKQVETVGKESLEYAYTLFTLANLYAHTHEPQKALDIQQQILPLIAATAGKDSYPYQVTLANIATSYYELKQFEEAERLSLQLLKQTPEPSAISINNLGILYLSRKRLDEAEKQFKRVLSMTEGVNQGTKKTKTIAYINLADVYQHQNRLEEAHRAIRQALWTNGVDFSKEEAQALPIHELVLNKRYSDIYLVSTAISMLDKVYESQYKTTNELDILKKRHENLLLYAKYVEQMTTSFQTAGDKLWQLYIANDEYRRGIDVANLLAQRTGAQKWLEEALYYLESSKAMLLGNAMKNNTAYVFGNVPEAYLNQEKALRKEASNWQKKLEEALLLDDTKQVGRARQGIVQNDRAIQALITYLETNYPAYYHYKYGSSIISIEEARAVLPNEQTAILEYYFWEDSAYVMAITKQDVHLLGVDLSDKTLRVLVKSLRYQLSRFNNKDQKTPYSSAAYNKLAHQAYQVLVAPALSKLSNIKQLIVVPDNVLAQIPFEAFLTDSVETTTPYTDLPYLLREYSISYSYSLGLLTQNNRPMAQPTRSGILGFAPFYASTLPVSTERSMRHRNLRKKIRDLPAAQAELEALEQQFEGRFLYKEQASEAAFKEMAKQYSILHLAMHGSVNEHVPLLSSLIFTEVEGEEEDNFLEAHEISHLELNAELVVLSACETGYGQFKTGEGLFSLARSFMYAGAPSMVVSLWTVNDYSTAVVMEQFYQQLAAGVNKAEALRQAKLYYLEHNSGILAHPNFWSPFIQLGNPRPILLQERGLPWWWIGGGLLLVAVILGGFWTRRSVRMLE